MPLPLPPTILLAVGGLLLVAGSWMRSERGTVVIWLAGWCYAAWLLVTSGFVPMDSTARMALRSVWAADELACVGQGLALAFGLMFGVGSIGKTSRGGSPAERLGFLSFLVAGVMLVTSANDAISLALALELVQFASHGLRRRERLAESQCDSNSTGTAVTDAAASETAASGATGDRFEPPVRSMNTGGSKLPPVAPPRLAPPRHAPPRHAESQSDEAAEQSHDASSLWLGITASLCVWLGIALGASLTASTQFDDVRTVLAQAYSPGAGRVAIGAGSKLGLLALGLIVTGVGCRMGLVPWQGLFVQSVQRCGYWTGGCLLVSGQLAGVLALARLCGSVWIGFTAELSVLLIVLAAATSVLAGTMAARGLAIGEGRLRRWVAAFGMLHSAWLLVGVIAVAADLAAPENSLAASVGQPSALAVLLFSSGASLFGLSGLCLLLGHLVRDNREVEYLDELLGLGRLAPAVATALMIVLASLIGHPPLWGGWGQWLLVVAGFQVRAAVGPSAVLPHHGVILLLVVTTLSTLLLAVVVVRFARVMFLDEPVSRTVPQGGGASFYVGLFAALALVAVGLFPARLLVPLSGIVVSRPVAPEEQPVGKKTGSATARRE